MPLIDCPECNHRVSAAAGHCVQCGHPMRSQAREVQTIQATGKGHKLLQLAGVVLAVAGAVGMTQAPLFGLLMAAGAAAFLAGSFSGWLQHA
ncbi:MAG: hypothetical protein L0H83_12815 [Salinisphaera sp.]|nr:hypothetical protein [Salinisphaera sp.]